MTLLLVWMQKFNLKSDIGDPPGFDMQMNRRGAKW